MIEAVLALLLAASALGLALASLTLARRILAVREKWFHAEVIVAEALRLQRAEQALADAQRLAEGVFSGGTQTVRAIHKGIAAIPFGILEAIPATRDTTRIVRASHDLISDAVYGTLGAVNRGVGAGLRAGLRAGLPKSEPTARPDETPPRDAR